MGLFDAIQIAGSGLAAERVRMDVTSENLANAQTTRTASGQPYKRQEVVLEQNGTPAGFASHLQGAMSSSQSPGTPEGGVEVSSIVSDKAPDQLVYDPGNPEANAKGYVEMPDISTVTEMVDLISESRSYQSDVTAMQTAKSMFTATLGLLK
jgi:flagellar basal-body rod protein FlgC